MVAVTTRRPASRGRGIPPPADRITVSSQGVLMKSYGCCLLSSGAPGVPARPSPIWTGETPVAPPCVVPEMRGHRNLVILIFEVPARGSSYNSEPFRRIQQYRHLT